MKNANFCGVFEAMQLIPTRQWPRKGGPVEKDIRFTRNKVNTVIYAIVRGWPFKPILARSLGLSAATSPDKITRVELLGTGTSVDWKKQTDALQVQLPKD